MGVKYKMFLRIGSKKAKKTKTREVHLLSNDSSFAVQEAYRTLRTNVMFSLTGSECKVIMVTSGLQGEAKSTTAMNLAIALAQNKSKVLLIDCDLRLPTIASSFQLKNQKGLTDVLVQNAKLRDCISTQEEGLNILASGTIPPNPVELSS